MKNAPHEGAFFEGNYMKILHTADWHLGKSLRGYSLLDDQAYILSEFLRLADEERPDVVVIAGDIYDRGIPPAQAVALLNEVLTKLVLEKKIPVIAIAGNHDSGSRLSFGGEFLARSGLFLRGLLNLDAPPVILPDEFGNVAFSLLPYFEPGEVDITLSANDADAATQEAIRSARAKIPAGCRSVAVAHLFALGGVSSESERPLSLGGTQLVAPNHFAAFDYAALGHLHAPQRVQSDKIRYSGSLLKYSFDEAHQKKGVVLVSLNGEGMAEAKNIPLTPKRDVRIVEGYMEDIRRNRDKYPVSDDFVLVKLLDKTAILAAYDKLSAVYPYLAGIEFCNLTYDEGAIEGPKMRENLSETELFADFFREMTGETLTAKEEQLLSECVREVYRAEREGDYATANS